MGHQSQLLSSSEAAPAYDEHGFNHEHPVNAVPSSGPASAYATVPQNESDIELAHDHTVPISSNVQSSFTPHQHCETCDTLTSKRKLRANERHCCMWTSIVFMTISVALLLLGIVAVDAKYKHRRE
ncbi:uncharacterized protein EKO05_0001134 [Ascochyta rabiei]|uniref:Uncharacterized protein n=1 Tax=Didymella rabiei TaxID=5454 RepID=A0A162YQU4_DIDRA|nr:uncharacterized protein EKO05_0001134 [Ascochyta rabiei]KZM20174.1 hypothetical protein ST47_g8678 [Ascochyta rabiei]UPX10476.1 hypothetical protein EKO05_0001134 [Ascochyta rabiei]